MAVVASVSWSLAVLALAGAGLATLVGWSAGAAFGGRTTVTLVLVGSMASLPWSRWFTATLGAFDAHDWTVVVAGHVALGAWLMARRFAPRFLDERARGRTRRPFERNRGSR